MFSFTIDEILKDVEEHVRLAGNCSSLISGFTGDMSSQAVNHLMMSEKGKGGFLISEYVSCLLSEVCEASFLRQARKSTLAHTNHSFDGWILESDFLYQLRCAETNQTSISVVKLMVGMQACDREQEQWNVSERISFAEDSDVKELLAYTSKQDIWLIPKQWNHGSYDAVHIFIRKVVEGKRKYKTTTEVGVVRFVQVTHVDKHGFKPEHAISMLTQVTAAKFYVDAIEVVFVVPHYFDSGTIDPMKYKIIGDWPNSVNMIDVEQYVYSFTRTN